MYDNLQEWQVWLFHQARKEHLSFPRTFRHVKIVWCDSKGRNLVVKLQNGRIVLLYRKSHNNIPLTKIPLSTVLSQMSTLFESWLFSSFRSWLDLHCCKILSSTVKQCRSTQWEWRTSSILILNSIQMGFCYNNSNIFILIADFCFIISRILLVFKSK